MQEKTPESIEKSFEITQGMSEQNKGRNFRCPVCDVKRITKGLTPNIDGWYHTGCRCTHSWLGLHDKLIK